MGCVPYNIFTAGGVTQAAFNYFTTPGFQQGATTEHHQRFCDGGPWLLWREKSLRVSSVGVAFGTEYRREA